MGDFDRLTAAFAKDKFIVKDHFLYQGRLGIMAEHNTAVNSDNNKPKKAFYVEGSSYEMGYLLGYLAEPDVSSMTTDFADSIVLSFISDDVSVKGNIIKEVLGKLIMDIAKDLSKHDHIIVPPELDEEMNGILKGCRDITKKQGKNTKVTKENLLMINLGHDILCSMIYTGDFLSLNLNEQGIQISDLKNRLKQKKEPIEPGDVDAELRKSNIPPQEDFFIKLMHLNIKSGDLKLPMMCNGFSVFGKSAGGGHYMGRDFMFPTGGVYQDTACFIINNPVNVYSEDGIKALPTVNLAAPGFVGSPTSMNSKRICCGVQIVAAGNCTPDSIGVNSLLLVRHTAQFADSAENAVKIMAGLEKGVSWLYLVGDGENDRACVVEAGSSKVNRDFLFYPDQELKNNKFFPDHAYLNSHKTADWQNGIMVRWNDYRYHKEYLDLNKDLYSWYNEHHDPKIVYREGAFSENACIDDSLNESNCAGTYYFTPQRESNDEYLLVTNSYIIPEMRLAMMWDWSAMINGSKSHGIAKTDDIQWRYDKLNQLFHLKLSEGVIDYEKAKELIDYLSPASMFGDDYAHYYDNGPQDDGWRRIEGSTALCDLKNMTIEAHYGYFKDEWVKITLPNYI